MLKVLRLPALRSINEFLTLIWQGTGFTALIIATAAFLAYMFGMCLRLLLGECPDDHDKLKWSPCTLDDQDHRGELFNPYFGTVALSVYTVFRCWLGGA